MKFGKVLQQSTQMSPSAWEPYWADYKLLKKIIKDCAQIKKEEKLQGDKLVKIKIKPSAKEDNDSIRACCAIAAPAFWVLSRVLMFIVRCALAEQASRRMR